MNKFKSHFWYNKRQRNGILFLTTLILALQFLYFFIDFTSDEKIIESAEAIRLQQRIDSLKLLALENQQPKIFPFNPNFISDFKGYQLGMNPTEIDQLLAFRKTGRFINSAEEFQQVTKISDSLLQIISPYFQFPEWVTADNKKSNFSRENKTETKNQLADTSIKKDLNLATTEELQSVYGIGEKLANRIITYRTSLQGYSYDEQLYEVYYLEKITAEKVLQRFSVQQKPDIKKVNLNKATFKEILNLPYIDYGLTKRIFNYRKQVNSIENLDELKKIDSFPLEKFDRIALYLTIQ